MDQLFYDDDLSELKALPNSIFLAGPTVRGVPRTPWRMDALRLLEERGFDGTALIPEFQERPFEVAAPIVFAEPQSDVPQMRTLNYNVLRWETAGIERSTVVLFWMPFSIAHEDDPASLPGFTTRAEVSRELVRDPGRIVLGMPPRALSSGHIRFHAHQAGVTMHTTLEATIDAALSLARRS